MCFCSKVVGGAFHGCESLSFLLIAGSSPTYSFSAGTFEGCFRLVSFYLLGSNVFNTMYVPSVFSSTPIVGYTEYTDGVYGSIFVRASLYNTYISATNWVTISSRFVSLTDAQIAALGVS